MNIKLYFGSELADFNEAFNVLFSIGDIRDLSYGSNNKTYTLNLPLTKTNKRLIKFISQPDVKSEPSSMGRLYIGEQLIIQGTILIRSLTDYFVSIIITSDDWLENMKTRMMTELDLSASDHAFTSTNVENSWSAAYPVYRYPMIDFGALASAETGSSAKWFPNDFIPMIRVVDLLTKIITPYTLSSAWLATSFIKDLYILGRETIAPGSFIEGKDCEVRGTAAVDNQDTESIPGTSSGTASLTDHFVELTTDIINEGNRWTGTHRYIAPETGTYRLVATMISYSNSDYAGFTETAGSFLIEMLQTGSASRTLASATAARVPVATTYTLDSGFIHLVAGDEVRLKLNCSSTVTNNTPNPVDLVIGLAATSHVELIWSNANRHSGLNKTISLEEMLPVMTQLDFVTAIRNIFNLRFWMDKSRQVVYIEPWDSFVSSTVVDMTEFVDFESIETELISPNYFKNILLRWKTDTADKAYEEYLKTNEDINEKEITLTSEFLKQGIDTRESYFSSLVKDYSRAMGNWTLLLPAIWAEVLATLPTAFNRLTGFNARIVEWKGLTAGLTWNYGTVSKNTYPKIDALDFDTLYTTYWMKLLHYVDKGKIFIVRMKVKPAFLTQLFTVISTAASEGFRPTYQITINGIDNYFFLQKVTTDGDICEMELILRQ